MIRHEPRLSADTSQRFPDNFVFGGATAAYQEGACQSHGKGKVAWDDYPLSKAAFHPSPPATSITVTIATSSCASALDERIRVSIA
ncbi:MAG: family 1 glycosylhydrolase [Collinsella aerofaciens]